MANAVLATLSHMYTLAERWGAVSEGANPCQSAVKYPARRRERFLTDAEFDRLCRVLDDAPVRGGASPPAIVAIRLLMLTGCRKNEILALRWEDADLEAGDLALADAKTGRTGHANAASRELGEPPHPSCRFRRNVRNRNRRQRRRTPAREGPLAGQIGGRKGTLLRPGAIRRSSFCEALAGSSIGD